MKYVAFYFPQFQQIPENDRWWGSGFTDWDLVRHARAHSSRQRQPRKPLGGNFYDLSDPDAVARQAELAERFGLYAFNFYHYWFDGRLMLGRPAEYFLQDKSHNLKFCFTWANESWTRQWVGNPEILLRQSHRPDPKIWAKHFYYLVAYFSDHRYIRIDGRPVFFIYRPELNPHLCRYVAFFNHLAVKEGLPGVYFIGLRSYPLAVEKKATACLDAHLRFQPRYIMNSEGSNRGRLMGKLECFLRSCPEAMQLPLALVKHRLSGAKAYDYDQFCQRIIELAERDPEDHLQSIIVDWDNTARYGDKSRFFTGVSPERFAHWLEQLTRVELSKGRDMIFINAWNEWSEGAYLEPDEVVGYRNLEVVRTMNQRYGGNACSGSRSDSG